MLRLTASGVCPRPRPCARGSLKRERSPGNLRSLRSLPTRSSEAAAAKFPLQHVTVHCFHELGIDSRDPRALGWGPLDVFPRPCIRGRGHPGGWYLSRRLVVSPPPHPRKRSFAFSLKTETVSCRCRRDRTPPTRSRSVSQRVTGLCRGSPSLPQGSVKPTRFPTLSAQALPVPGWRWARRPT